ncbi:AAA family ATPase [Petralouisia muris]|uniref:AAA family ATPase n=1 Tax=Petralouisia muris TaxID=3032872 RepID=UPI0026C3B15A
MKPLPIGVDDFEEIILKNYYYVDKTLMIKELLDKRGKVNQFTRPRRFGKTPRGYGLPERGIVRRICQA